MHELDSDNDMVDKSHNKKSCDIDKVIDEHVLYNNYLDSSTMNAP